VLNGKLFYFSSKCFGYFNFRRGRYYVVLVKDAPKYVTHGFQPAVPLAGSDFNKICVTFKSESIFTHTDVQNYFRYHHLTSVFDAF
jgi:hypothetical protein